MVCYNTCLTDSLCLRPEHTGEGFCQAVGGCGLLQYMFDGQFMFAIGTHWGILVSGSRWVWFVTIHI